MNKLPLIAIVILIAACSAFAQTAPDAAELTRLLNEFLAGASRGDAAVHERFWADDLIYTRSAGRRVTKADVMRGVRSEPPPKPGDPTTIYTAEDIRIQQYGDTAIVAFRLVATSDSAGAKHVANLLNSGTFVKRNGKWQVVNWQSTRMPRTDEESTSEVAVVVHALNQSFLTPDQTKLASLIDPNFVWSRDDSEPLGRKLLIDNLTSGKLKFARPETAKVIVSIYGETAVVRGWLLKETTAGKPQALLYMLTLVNQIDGWKAVAMHTSSRGDDPR